MWTGIRRSTVWFKRKRITVALVFLGSVAAASAQGADDGVGHWTISHSVAALTDLPTVSARLESTEILSNMIGAPERASLILRCKDRELAAYVSWPEFLPRDTESAFLNVPQKLVLQRIDDGTITRTLWDISSDGTAVGGFDSRNALKVLVPFEHAKKLVVRLTGRTTQDATFDLEGIAEVAAQIRSACQITPATEPARSLAEYGPPVQVTLHAAPGDIVDQTRRILEANGYQIDPTSTAQGALVSKPKSTKLTTKDADCGRYAGLPYLIDKRAETKVSLRVTIRDATASIEAKVDGTYNVAPPRVLNCRSLGHIEKDIGDKLIDAVH